MRCVSIIGQKDTGKTTLLLALVGEFRRQGHRVSTIKHAAHPAVTDQQGTDSYRHFHEAMSDQTLLVTPTVRVLSERAPDDQDPRELARRFLTDADVVLVEGYKQAGLPRVEVFRRAVATVPFYQDTDPFASQWIAIITDDTSLRAACPVLRFEDTMWLHLLASMILEKAEVVE